MLMVGVKRMMKMRDYCVVLLPFFLNRLFVTAQPSKKHGHELRVVKKFPVTRLQRLQAESRALMNERVRSATPQETRHLCRMKSALFGAMANVVILEQIWQVKPIWSTTFILIRIFEAWLLYALMSALSRVHPGQRPYHIRNMMSAA